MRKKIVAVLLASTIISGHNVTSTNNTTINNYVSNYVTEQAESVTSYKMYTTTRVNVRLHCSTNSSIVKVLDKAEKVYVLKTKDSWSRIKSGWIKSEYLSKSKPKDELLVTESERYWLYQLVEAEAGIESRECRAWICSTVFNLMELECTPNDVKSMIFYKNTYSPTLDGRIYSVKPTESTKEVVDSVLRNGVCTNALFFEADYCHSSWHQTRQKLRQIDHTIFYK